MGLRVRLSFAPVVVAMGLMMAAGGAQADSCVDLRTGQTWDCKGPPPQVAPGQPAPAPSQLRELLRKRLATSAKTAVDRDALVDRYLDARSRADNALRSASLTNDPAEKAQFKRAYEAAQADMRGSVQQLIDSAPDAVQKQGLTKNLQALEANYAAQARDAGLTGNAPPPQQAAQPAAPPRSDVFSVCDQPKNGVTACYEMGRTGNDCLEVLYQGGERTYENGHKTCSAEDMKQRDAFFAGQPVGQGPPADPRSEQLAGLMASLSPQCQQDLKSYLYNSRDSKTSGAAGNKAMQSFSNINSSQDCKAGFERLAGILGVEIPQRHLSGGARSAWANGMADKPRETVNVPDVPQGNYAYDPDNGGGWNTGEVLNTGAQVLGILGAILGGFAEGYAGGGYSSGPVYTSRPSYGYGGPSGRGYVYRGGNSSNSNSTITGIGSH